MAKNTRIKKVHTLTLDGFLAVGSWQPYNIKAELYDFGSAAWTEVEDYPFASGSFVAYIDMVFIPEESSYFVIGGFSGSDLSQIARFKDGEWSDAGQLNTARQVSFTYLVYFSLTGPTIRLLAPSGSTMLSSLQVEWASCQLNRARSMTALASLNVSTSRQR